MTFFGNADPSFLPVPEDKRVETGPFLAASRYIIPFFEKFGKSFTLVKSDVEGNIEKISKKYTKDPEKYRTLNDILTETYVKGDDLLKDALVGTIWLTRGLDFIQKMLDMFVKDYEDCSKRDGNSSVIIQLAYEETLKQHHGMVMKRIFPTVCKLAPTKPDLLSKLKESKGVTDDQENAYKSPKEDVYSIDLKPLQVIADMKDYHKNLAETAVVLQQTIDDLELKEPK